MNIPTIEDIEAMPPEELNAALTAFDGRTRHLNEVRENMAHYRQVLQEDLKDNEKVRRALRDTARKLYTADDEEIDDDARVSISDCGAWVQAWLFVYPEDFPTIE